MSELVVRSYNVGFGDAVLVSIPDRSASGRETLRHVVIDVGNLLAGDGNQDDVFVPVVADLAQRTGGTVDLYVMTHEHLDHVQGLKAAQARNVDLKARYAWLTGSAHPDYYTTHPNARKKRLEFAMTLADVERQLAFFDDPWLEFTVRNNSALLPPGTLGLATADYVDHLRNVAPRARTTYVDRTTDVSRRHPFKEARLRILAPEEDTFGYYDGRPLNRLVLDGAAADARPAPSGRRNPRPERPPSYASPPAGVEPGAFFDLLASRNRNRRDSVLQIDRAANNTSVVLEIEWRGWRLLFGGDAEELSWETMHHHGMLRPCHLVKIAHHGSVNGTVAAMLDEVLPAAPPDPRPRHAIVSTHDEDWDSVPDPDTLDLYRARATLHDTRSVARGTAVEVRLPG